MQLDLFKFDGGVLKDEKDSVFTLFDDLTKYELDKKSKKSDRHNSIDEAILKSEILRSWQDARSGLTDYPIYSRYLSKYREFDGDDYDNLNSEIKEKGVLLPAKQLLFRGAISGTQGFDWTRPLSTTIHPRMAAYHALKHWEHGSDCHLTLAAIIVPLDKKLNAIVGPFGEDLEFGQEYEVLTNFESSPVYVETKTEKNITYQILSWQVK